MKTVLIADSDLGFLAFLSKALSQAGYDALPSSDVESVGLLLDELGNPRVDLLIVNLALSGVSDIVTMLKERNESLKIISVEGLGVGVTKNIRVDGSLRKPAPSEVAQIDEWLRMVKQLLVDV